MNKCDRCGEQCISTTGSYFNTEMICPSCDMKEQNHSEFEKARRIENEEVKSGNLNYPGIGLPKDLK